MSGPFTDADSGALFIANRCDRCRHRLGVDEPCDAFTPAYIGDWPEILTWVPLSDQNPVGVECTRFEVAW